MLLVLFSIFLTLGLTPVMGSELCIRKDFEAGFVCVCNSTYCDERSSINELPQDRVVHILSDAEQYRLHEEFLSFSNSSGQSNATVLTIDRFQRFQEIFGWGGAFTDAAGINIASLSAGTQDKLLRSYFDKRGLDYNIGRVNMGGCDFSTRTYTYLDTPGDLTLETFALQEEDLVYKIPYIKKAEQIKETPLKLFASPWTAPKWMKSNNDYIGQGYLLPEYYQVWANYFLRFLDEYELKGVTFWGLTAQNEPEDGNIPDFWFNCMGWNSTTQRTWIVNNLGPTLENGGYGEVKLMILDDQRPLAPKWTREVLSDATAYTYVDGVAVHWYMDDTIGLPHALDMVHEEFPDKFILYTESCNGEKPWEGSPVLGSWPRANEYLKNILEDLNHWTVGWTDWNLALDLQGGPNWAGNFVDSPIIVNATADEFYKQPMYYAFAHVSRYIPEGSTRIGLDESGDPLGRRFSSVAAERPDGGVTLVLLNRDKTTDVSVTLYDPDRGYIDLVLGPSSMHTLVYW